jgi:VCBS repeat-containing protein
LPPVVVAAPEPASPTATAPQAVAVAVGMTESVPVSPTGLGGPNSPVETTASWVMLAAARRLGRPERSAVTASVVATGQVLVAKATALNPIAVLLFNQTPTLSAAQTAQSPTGVVSGDLGALDPDSTPLSYAVVGNPAHGTVAVDSAGHYSYTPDAALAHAGLTDTFRVTVSDAGSGFHIHGLAGLINLLTFGLIGDSQHATTATVTVTVTPVNALPVVSLTVGAPNASTGVVAGRVNAVDADSDPLSYSGPTTTAKGTVVVAANGSFSYTPTATARHAASSLTATQADRADTFTLTVDDGHGGVLAVPVSVAISPTNNAPNATAVVGAPNASTGVVAGTAIGVDADGDPLTYAGSTTTAKGAVVVAANGGFTYTPTAAARHAAAAPNATPAEKERGQMLAATQLMSHLASAFSVFSLAFLAVPLAVRVGRSETFVNASVALGVALTYYLLTSMAAYVKDPALRPDVLIWLPNLVVLGLAWFRLRRASRH